MAVFSDAGVVNQAIEYMGDDQSPVTGNAPNFDVSIAGVAAANLYIPAVQTVARAFQFDFTRNTVALAVTGNTPLAPFSVEYAYPASAIELLQIMPRAPADLNNPLPFNWQIANTLVGGLQTKAIQCDLANAQAIIVSMPPVPLWDAGFRECVARLLASQFAMAISGKPDVAQAQFEIYQQSLQLFAGRPD